ncbi:asparagine synthase (glutamine-hydrolyzing) [Natronomonas halophila]|uniref:asparagine synthase (glutamine-hydrolyzing) n=1 Tax=Natronomonas halophila TaxID=2747817 RepID=UPI0015B4966E|nr:asparagine synthase (glutamine-hydrolyzing) [Natronomonas halophila]QLD86843.1 asparagine synthase (glutamine-hydrolyzing) [Natronomonas halophila]
MCGIVGVYGRTNDEQLGRMLADIHHRGPDDEGRFHSSDPPLMMGARRLSIVDLEGGDQPISNEDGTITVVFNGEIYNFPDLKDRLESKGHTFQTDCDTEILVHLWEEYGTDLPTHLNGMFAFSLWDAQQEQLFLARDRLGIKPLYYADTDDEFIWGSEVASLLTAGVERRIDPRALYNYLWLKYTPWPQTLFRDIRKVPPGASLLIEDGETHLEHYWEIASEPVDDDPATVHERIRDGLRESVERRLMADVPVGAFLSGGVDSSAIVAMLDDIGVDDIMTFSIAFESAPHDESDEARFVAEYFGTDHHEITVDLESMTSFDDLIRRYGEPLADPAVLPTMLLAEHASEEVKVVLSGEGADELFAGYRHYRKLTDHRDRYGSLPNRIYDVAALAANVSPVGQRYLQYFSDLSTGDRAFRHWARSFDEYPDRYATTGHGPVSSGLVDIISDSFAGHPDDTVKSISTFEVDYWLPDDLLYKVDHATMAASLEARVPFLDHEFVEYAYNLPSEQKNEGQAYKPLLKRAVGDLLPNRIFEREKHGLSVPIDEWFREEHEAIASQLTRERVENAEYIDAEAVFEMWDEHRSGEANNALALWKVLNYVAWYHEFVDV